MIGILAIFGILLAFRLSIKCKADFEDDYAKGMDEYHLKMREIHGDNYTKWRARQKESRK